MVTARGLCHSKSVVALSLKVFKAELDGAPAPDLVDGTQPTSEDRTVWEFKVSSKPSQSINLKDP